MSPKSEESKDASVFPSLNMMQSETHEMTDDMSAQEPRLAAAGGGDDGGSNDDDTQLLDDSEGSEDLFQEALQDERDAILNLVVAKSNVIQEGIHQCWTDPNTDLRVHDLRKRAQEIDTLLGSADEVIVLLAMTDTIKFQNALDTGRFDADTYVHGNRNVRYSANGDTSEDLLSYYNED